ncbi:MAG: hypothetical protein COB45_13230 [Gammaproteobacteria bacterium]|nr:MAG: hypothetical protein COB45_13230 [Gammaproteobacteria bacterium]PHR83358.1 MAG: hypothetical protein COA59_12260 [Colwellia sp.]
MPRLLRSVKKVKKIELHPIAQLVLSVISDFNFIFYTGALTEEAESLIESSIRLEGILDDDGMFQVISPIFLLRISRVPLESLIKKDTITYQAKEFQDDQISKKIWGDFFVQLLSSFNNTDLALLKVKLNEFLPRDMRYYFFNQNVISEKCIAKFSNLKRGVLARQTKKLRLKQKTSFDSFIPYSNSDLDEN